MNNYIIIFLVFLFPFALNAQTAFSDLARSYAESGNFDEAIRLESQSIELLKRAPENDENYVIAIANLAFYNEQIGNYNEALILELEALNILKQLPNCDLELMALLMIDLASYYTNVGNYQQSVVIGMECCELIVSNFGKDHRTYLTCLNNLAGNYSLLGEHENAYQISTEILELLKASECKDTTYEISPLLIISNHYLEIGNYTEALKNAELALKISKSLEDHNYEISRCLNIIAGIYDAIGDYQKCLEYAEESVTLRKLIDGENSPAFARAVNNLSQFYAHAGNYKEAIKYGELAKTIRLQVFGEDHPEYLNSIHSLACIYSDLGNYKDAKVMDEIVANKRRGLWGEEHPSFLNALMGVSTSNAYLGKYKEAVSTALRIDSILNLSPLQDATLYSTNLNNISWFYSCEGQFNESFIYASKSIEFCKNKFGDSSLEYFKALNSLSYLYYKQNNFKEAINTEEYILSGIERIWGEEHPLFIESIADLTVLYSYNNDENMLRVYAPLVLEKIRNKYTSYFSFLTLSERNKVWAKRKSLFCKTFPKIAFEYSQSSHEYVSLAYDATLFSKGILLNSEIEFYKFLTNLDSDVINEKYNQLRQLRRQLTKSYEKPRSEIAFDFDSLKRKINILERQIMQKSAEFGDYTHNLTITWDDVRNKLNDNDAAIEFVHFPLNNDSTMYMAYVLRKDMEAPSLVKLFEEKELTILSDKELYTQTKASKLIWEKLESEFENVENVYFAPDGVLHQIAVEYMPDFVSTGHLISDKYNLHRLSSTRELALKKNYDKSNYATVYGGIKYDSDTETMVAESRKYEKSTTRGFEAYYNVADSISSVRSRREYLPFALIEAEKVDSLLIGMNYNSSMITGEEATEESFKNISGKENGILHIATHGFYWDEDYADYRASINDRFIFISKSGDNARKDTEDKALTRSGLFMAGANNALSGKEIPESVDDGILTAQEIANLDLRGLDLVVLSACQTGMGDISGDGVFGLQRGFKKAGANTILMSLWDVNDEATQILMTEFYNNYLSGKSKQESLRLAQQSLRNNSEYSDPEYWAAFILLDGIN